MDVLFNPRNNITFHVICSFCNQYIGILEKNKIAVKCAECKKLTKVIESECTNFFITLNPEDSIKSLLEENSDYYLHVMNVREFEKEVYSDIYDGEMYRDFKK